jgi:hypothetical protein
MSTTKLAFQLLAASNYIDALGGVSQSYRQALASYEAEPAVQVVVERERVWVKRGVQSFMLAYEAETDAEREWYAGQLRSLLAAPAAPAERLALTPEWLWLQLMDWCKKRGSHPSEHNALFAIVSEARKLAAPAAPAELHSEALLYAGKARTMAAKLFNDPQASQVDAGDLLLYMARLVDELCRAAAPAAPAPLTDEQIDRLIEHSDCWTGPGLGASFKKEVFARLVEQAHGIAASKGGA